MDTYSVKDWVAKFFGHHDSEKSESESKRESESESESKSKSKSKIKSKSKKSQKTEKLKYSGNHASQDINVLGCMIPTIFQPPAH